MAPLSLCLVGRFKKLAAKAALDGLGLNFFRTKRAFLHNRTRVKTETGPKRADYQYNRPLPAPATILNSKFRSMPRLGGQCGYIRPQVPPAVLPHKFICASYSAQFITRVVSLVFWRSILSINEVRTMNYDHDIQYGSRIVCQPGRLCSIWYRADCCMCIHGFCL